MASLRANIPAGGKPGQVIKKKTYTDFDVYWADDKQGGGSSPELEEKVTELENDVGELGTKVTNVTTDLNLLESIVTDIDENKQDKIVGTKGQFVGFDDNGNPIATNANPGGGGVTDHQLLTNRDAESAHPISAITGLETQLSTLQTGVSNAVTAEDELSVLDIIKIMEES